MAVDPDSVHEQQLLPLEGGQGVPPPKGYDADLDKIEEWWRKQSSAVTRVGEVIRQAFDQVLDAERTGRYDLSDLTEEEREYLIIRFRIVLRDEFNLPHGPGVDGLSLGVEGLGVEVLFEPSLGWAVPAVAVGEICVLVSASDDDAKYSFGVLRTANELIRSESGAVLTAYAVERVRWLWRYEQMPKNILKTLPPGDVQAIFAMSGKGNGQGRIDELFRRVQGRIVPRILTATVAHQEDPMKRPRTSRRNLQPQGIVILGHQNDHPRICAEFGLPVPRKGELIAVRVVKATLARQLDRQFVRIDGTDWVVADPSEPDEAGPANY